MLHFEGFTTNVKHLRVVLGGLFQMTLIVQHVCQTLEGCGCANVLSTEFSLLVLQCASVEYRSFFEFAGGSETKCKIVERLWQIRVVVTERLLLCSERPSCQVDTFGRVPTC